MSPIWGTSATANEIKSLQTAQNNSLRSIFRADYYRLNLSTADIRKKYNLFDVKQIIDFDTALLAFKIKRNLIKCDLLSQSHSICHTYHTRNSNNIIANAYRTNIGKVSIHRVISAGYNKIPQNIRDCTTIHSFKHKFKTFIMNL